MLTAAYLENPSDPELALLLPHVHLWTLSERSRGAAAADPGITDHAILADRYFGEAHALASSDARIGLCLHRLPREMTGQPFALEASKPAWHVPRIEREKRYWVS